MEAARRRDFPSAMGCLGGRVPASGLSSWKYLRPFSTLQEGYAIRIFELFYQELAMRRMAAGALAMRLYEIDHGRRPDRLAELVPKYLPAVPADPYVAGGKATILYLPTAKRPLLYCVGQGSKDDGGKYSDGPAKPVHWEKYDLPFFLNADRPCERPAKKTPATRRTRRRRPRYYEPPLHGVPRHDAALACGSGCPLTLATIRTVVRQ